ncbi:MAG: hypothetical protein ABIS86_09280 [Streptosporangiaceae bacterium]
MTQYRAPGTGESGYPGLRPAQAGPAGLILGIAGAVFGALLTASPFLPWVTVSSQGIPILLPASSESWSALDEIEGVSHLPGYLALAAGVLALALSVAGLVIRDKRFAAAVAAPALLGLAAIGLFVQQMQSYQDKFKDDFVARLAQAVLDIHGALGLGWFLCLGASVVLLALSLAQAVRKA